MTTLTTSIQIATPDGPCETEVVKPQGSGKWPAVVLLFDAGGLRPAITHMAERIASGGYVVLTPNLFHRAPPLRQFLGAEVTQERVSGLFKDPVLGPQFRVTYYGPAIDYGNLAKTVGAVLEHCGARQDVTGKVGMTGYCMGGNAAVRSAAILGDRLTAVTSFHPGGLVTDVPESPHLRAQAIKAWLYLAPSAIDLAPEAEAKLRAELDAGKVRYELEHYDAKHGFAVPDAGGFDAASAERAHAALERVFGETLR